MELTRKLLNSTTKALADQRLVTTVCSTADPDRMGDIIVQAGINLAPYRRNPIVLWGHSADVPIARAIEIGIKDDKLQATVQFPPEGDDEDSDWVYGKIKAGIVNATSVGFLPTQYEPLDPKQPWAGLKFLKSELLEFSFVSVPANSGCLIVGRSLFSNFDVPLLPSMARSSNGSSLGDAKMEARLREAANIRKIVAAIGEDDRTPQTPAERLAEVEKLRRTAFGK